MCLRVPNTTGARIALALLAIAATLIIVPVLVYPSNTDPLAGPPYFPADHPLSAPALAARNVAAVQEALALWGNSSWADFDGGKVANLTGFRGGDGFAWDDLGEFRERCGEIRDGVLAESNAKPGDDGVEEGDPVWRNVSGIVHGNWIRRDATAHRGWESYNLSAIAPWLDWSEARSEWERNVTGAEGAMAVLIHNKDNILDWNSKEHDNREHDNKEHDDKLHPKIPYRASMARGIRADVTVEDFDGDSSIWDMRMHGVHFPREGTLFLTTSSEKFDGIFGLPFLMPDQDRFLPGRELLSNAIEDILEKRVTNSAFADGAIPWSADLETGGAGTTTPGASCEYVLFAQIVPPRIPPRKGVWGWLLTPFTLSERIAKLEAELEDPVGLHFGPVPALEVSTLLWSPDCAFFLESTSSGTNPGPLVGVKNAVQRWRINRWILSLALIMYGQVRLLQLQIREASTPSTMGRISFSTLAVMVVVDGTIFAVAATWSLSAGYTLLPCFALVFTSFAATAVGGGFLARVHETQMPVNRERTASVQTTTATPPPTSDTDPLLPLFNTHTRQEPIIMPSDQDLDAEIQAQPTAAPPTTTTPPTTTPTPSVARSFQSLIRIFILTSIILSLISLASTSWHPTTRNIYLNICLFGYASLWLPQILRNITRNSRRSLAWRFVAGQSILRFAPLAYFWCWEDNFAFARTDRRAFFGVIIWLCAQMAIIAVQDVLGPRFALPESWTPPVWDYHRVLREDAIESGMLPVGILSSPTRTRAPTTSSTSSRTHTSASSSSPPPTSSNIRIRSVDCAICTDRVEVAVIRAGAVDDSGVAGVLARRTYMATPCRHIFHSVCLEAWMRHKLQCPICREELPPM